MLRKFGKGFQIFRAIRRLFGQRASARTAMQRKQGGLPEEGYICKMKNSKLIFIFFAKLLTAVENVGMMNYQYSICRTA